MTSTLYTASVTLMGYSIVAYDTSEAKVIATLGKAARKFARQNGFTLEKDWAEYYGANASAISIGHAFVEGSDTPIV